MSWGHQKLLRSTNQTPSCVFVCLRVSVCVCPYSFLSQKRKKLEGRQFVFLFSLCRPQLFCPARTGVGKTFPFHDDIMCRIPRKSRRVKGMLFEHWRRIDIKRCLGTTCTSISRLWSPPTATTVCRARVRQRGIYHFDLVSFWLVSQDCHIVHE